MPHTTREYLSFSYHPRGMRDFDANTIFFFNFLILRKTNEKSTNFNFNKNNKIKV